MEEEMRQLINELDTISNQFLTGKRTTKKMVPCYKKLLEIAPRIRACLAGLELTDAQRLKMLYDFTWERLNHETEHLKLQDYLHSLDLYPHTQAQLELEREKRQILELEKEKRLAKKHKD